MKRLLSITLAFCVLMTVLLPITPKPKAAAPVSTLEYTQSNLKQLPKEPSFDYNFLPASPRWQELVANEQPAAFKVKYDLADNVVKVNKTVTGSIADMGQILSGSAVQKLKPNRIIEKGGYIPTTVLDNAAAQTGRKIESGSVVVDEDSGTAFKVVSKTIYSGIFDSDPELSAMMKPLENTYSITKPQLHEVIKDFNLTTQTVRLNKANIKGFAPNIENSLKPFLNPKLLAVDDNDKTFKTLTGDNLIELQFKDTPLQGKVGNSTIEIKLSGGIAIDNIDVTGRYSSMGGYEISMKLKEECYLVAELAAEIHEEIKVPILGIGIPLGIGEVYGGIYAIIGMNGEFTLGIEARETSACKMGIEGGTFLYVPTSFHPIFEPEPPKITGDCTMLGKINGYVKFGPMLGIEIFGFDLVGAGVLLGAGVNVQSNGSILDIELYASIDVYIELADEYFCLVRARPTIYKKKQADMDGYKVSFLETYVNPGRVGGLIEKDIGLAFDPGKNLEYKIWIVPRIAVDSFDAAKRETILAADQKNTTKAIKDKVRTYPSSGFHTTNDEGEFIEESNDICYGGDNVYLEFKGGGKTFFVGPSTPVLPFTDITITYADYFNDFISGKVEPKRLIKWKSNRFDKSQEQHELTYYKGPINISPFNDYGIDREKIPTATQQTRNIHRPYVINGTARTNTDEHGVFDTRRGYVENGQYYPSGTIDVLSKDTLNKYIGSDVPPSTIGVFASLDINEEVKNITVYGITPAAPEFQFTRTLDLVESSYKRFNDGSKIVDQMAYDEYLWIANPIGTKTITADMFKYNAKGFSTQDYKGYYENPVKETRESPITLTPVLDKDGNPTGTSLFAQRVTIEWVWQAHPNPIKITSADHTQAASGKESSFQVTAEGFFPRFTLEGEPQRVWIDEKTGLLYIPNTLNPGVYKFIIHAKEGAVITQYGAPDPKRGNDPSPPDKQIFTLTVGEKPAESAETQTTGTTSTTTTESNKRVAPVIYKDEYNTYLNMDKSKDLVVPYKATGSEPITFSVEARSATGAPASGIIINSTTGVMTINKSIASGNYSITVTASNDVGKDTLKCNLQVKMPEVRTAPVLENRRDGYKFTMSAANTDFSVQLKATGSTPIKYSLEPVNKRIPVPAEVSIDAATGMLTVKGGLIGGIDAGTYSFIVKASNDVGSDTKECSLEVKASIQPPIRRTNPIKFEEGGSFNIVPLAVPPKQNDSQNQPSITLRPDLFAKEPPPNKLMLRCDDPKDVYTNDRNVYNGAHFICWDTQAVVSIIDVMVDSSIAKVYSDYTYYNVVSWGDEVKINDNSPVCDQYHYYDPNSPKLTLPLTKEQIEEIKASIKKAVDKEISDYKNGYKTMTQDFSTGGLRDRYYDFRVNPLDKTVSNLEYGTLLKEMNGKKDGAYNVELNMETGTVITGKYFTSLMKNPSASISFKQNGSDITFAGKDITKANDADMFNIGFTYAPHEKAIQEGIGSDSKSFAYGFQHHGALPGLATFSITTTLDEGAKVNVYKFDAAASQFTLIAGNVTVGAKGVVTYKNNTMSEYVITTKTLPGAAVSDVVKEQGSSQSNNWLLALIGLAVILIGAAAWIFLSKSKKTDKEKISEL